MNLRLKYDHADQVVRNIAEEAPGIIGLGYKSSDNPVPTFIISGSWQPSSMAQGGVRFEVRGPAAQEREQTTPVEVEDVVAGIPGTAPSPDTDENLPGTHVARCLWATVSSALLIVTQQRGPIGDLETVSSYLFFCLQVRDQMAGAGWIHYEP